MMAKGQLVDGQTRCVHWHSPVDLIAIKFKCCNTYYACFECHKQLADHKAEVLAIRKYFDSAHSCPCCHGAFNPNCSKQYLLYFEMQIIGGTAKIL